jgi:ribonuclease HI
VHLVSPEAFGGMGMKYLYTECSCQKIDCLINQFKTDSSLSHEMRLNLNWLQINTGTSIPILESNQELNYVDMNWFLSIKDFLNRINASIQLKLLWTPTIHRNGDILIMDEVIGLDISIGKKRLFNSWRLFFSVNTLSEMTNSQGTHIKEKFLNKYGVDTYIPSSLQKWPNQKPPAPKYFNIWLSILRAITGIDKAGKLKKKLGAWITGTKIQIPTNVNYLLHKNKKILAVRNPDNHLWSFYVRSHQLRSTIYFDSNDDVEMPPIDINEYETIDAAKSNEYYKINTRYIKTNKHNIAHHDTTNRLNKKSQVQEHIIKSTKWHHDITKNTQIIRNDILLESQNKRITISTDGGATHDKGSFGVVISLDEIIIATNKSRLPPIHNQIHSYRSEGFGILGGLIIYKEMFEYYKTNNIPISTDIIIKSDGKSMINKINRIRYWKKTQKQCNEKDMDVISEIITTLEDMRQLQIQVQLKFVKGHQDRNSNNLSIEASLNVAVDALATEGLKLRNIKEELIFPSDEAIIKLHGKVITANRTKILRDAFQSIQLRDYLKTSNNWSNQQIEKIWWKVHEKSLQTLTQGK